MADQNPQKRIVEKLKSAETVLVTVNTDPSVDELAAALGFTLLLNKMNKHATAVFSGAIPPAITFLDPEKTFENTTNSLRDFIIALDKEKADHLRYKVDGDMVKIFITPYRTTISDADLEFSQGDYNVEMVVAIGVKDDADLDKALADHGKIMHDATVASLSIGADSSDLGSINWHDGEASSYAEMLVSLLEAVNDDKSLIDEQIATAFLTGIVAATERFSNQLTTSKVMTMAAQLMAAGANQQLIATQLEEAKEIPVQAPVPRVDESISESNPVALTDTPRADGTMSISHTYSGDLDQVAAQTEKDNQDAAVLEATEALAEQAGGETALAADLAGALAAPQPAVPILDQLRNDIPQSVPAPIAPEPAGVPEGDAPLPPTPEMVFPSLGAQEPLAEPSFGGVLNATTEQAAEDALRAEAEDRNKQILSHDNVIHYVGNPPASLSAMNSTGDNSESEQVVSMFDPSPEPAQQMGSAPEMMQPHDEARAAIETALAAGPSTEQQQATVESTLPTPPEGMFPSQGAMPPSELPPLPPMPDFSTLPPLPGAPAPALGQPMGQDFSQPAPASDSALDTMMPPTPTPFPVDQPPVSNDPNQFQIPGQQ